MADNTEYKKRIADALLADKLDAMGAVLIEGPKACGKTTTAEQQANSILYMDDPDNMRQNLQLTFQRPAWMGRRERRGFGVALTALKKAPGNFCRMRSLLLC